MGSTGTVPSEAWATRGTSVGDAALAVRQTAVRGGRACTVRPAARSARPRTPPAPLRLTRRGRAVLVVLPAVLALVAPVVVLLAPAATSGTDDHAERTVVVHTGDTLWGIAERIAPGADPRDVVATIRRTNRVDDDLRPGVRLLVPAEIAG